MSKFLLFVFTNVYIVKLPSVPIIKIKMYTYRPPVNNSEGVHQTTYFTNNTTRVKL